MRLRNVPGSREAIAEHPLCILEENPQAGNWHTVFGNNHPIHIEVGMGKGQFITTLAQQNPEINYIGIEKIFQRAYPCSGKNRCTWRHCRKTCVLSVWNAENICNMFAEHEVDRIYLNFSDPWPKDRHAKRRLTSTTYLGRYDKILKPEGHVEFKTDNKDLFQFSLEQVEPAGWHLDAFTWDLHHDETLNQGNVMTEYEQKFSSMGNPICKLIVSR